jgi:hypothetical protein
MYTSQSKKLHSGEKFVLPYIKSVLQYTQQNTEFAHWLAQEILTHTWQSSEDTQYDTVSPYVSIQSPEDASDVAHWIIQSLSTHPEHKTARGILKHWAQNYESPKDLVLGIVGLAVIGPTLGIISSKKKKKRKSQLIIDKSYFAQLSKKDVALLTTQLTQRVMAQETKLAGGNVYNLHPDSAAWCVEEALTQIYTDSSDHIQTLLQVAIAENLSYSIERNTHGAIQAIVISPSVNDSLIDESEAEKI